METANLEDLARSAGFDDLDEMRELLLRLRLRTPPQRQAYERWASRDGTKVGLLRIIQSMEQETAVGLNRG